MTYLKMKGEIFIFFIYIVWILYHRFPEGSICIRAKYLYNRNIRIDFCHGGTKNEFKR